MDINVAGKWQTQISESQIAYLYFQLQYPIHKLVEAAGVEPASANAPLRSLHA